MICCIQVVWNSEAELYPRKTSAWAHVPVCHSGIRTVTLAAGHSSHTRWEMPLGCHSTKSHQSCPAKALCLDVTQKLPSAALSDTTLAAGKARKQPPPISRDLYCLASTLWSAGWFFFPAASLSFPPLLLVFLFLRCSEWDCQCTCSVPNSPLCPGSNLWLLLSHR